MISKSLFLLSVLTASLMAAPAFETREVSPRLGLHLRVGIFKPNIPVTGDILFLPGFADRLDNHGPLFQAWNEAGLRVISFDYPSHGETRGALNNINLYGFNALADLASAVEKATREDRARPLILAGWSTGGLLAVRIAQSPRPWERALRGLVLFAPGVSVYSLVGDKGFVTQATLTSNPNPPHRGPIRPKSPLLVPAFAASLLANSLLAQHEALPNLPTLVMAAGDREDRYAKTSGIKKWVLDQRKGRAKGITAVQCPGARHELDNEPAPVGANVRDLAVRFADSLVTGRPYSGPTDSYCRPF